MTEIFHTLFFQNATTSKQWKEIQKATIQFIFNILK